MSLHHPKNPWTDERRGLVRKLWAEGFSARQIALELGDDISRNAVIGVVHRMGLTKSYSPTNPGKAKRSKLSGSARNAMVERANQKRQIAAAAKAAKQVDDAEAATNAAHIAAGHYPNACTLLELTGDTCRWPIGDPATPNFFFCGAKPSPGSPYCAFHSDIAFNSPQDRKDARARERMEKAA